MSQDEKSAITHLAEFLTGPEVGLASVGLEMPERSLERKRADRFFELRKAFDVHGYCDAEQAEQAIKRAIAS